METIKTLVVLPDEMVGYTDRKKSCAMCSGTNANSSKNIILKVPPLIALDEVELAKIFDPFSNSILPLFHSTTPCCSQGGKC